ncbi:Polymerase/histidinol phosphatase-like protein [Cercophora newfieldiana]|uniref:Histidinol-phosphatase n=1 Tax=Cercophora newfieldiana TaxID=92897 RepID=A0AA40CQ89_9PEZI|nr:Polymerase/histidinol phosphatase-like protein [Cercophora newfieldiana]
MAFTMHSHSGQFCPGHAKGQLEDIIQHAIRVGYKTMGLTEHMPRTSVDDLYPEELTPSPSTTLASLAPLHAEFLSHASHLQSEYASQIHILIGFESEWLRPTEYLPLIRSLASDPRVDYFLGSLHHVSGIPIDYDKAFYATAVSHCGSERDLWATYYDEQYGMLTGLEPKVVGHFDLIRLMSSCPAKDVQRDWPEVWEKMVRNLREVKRYGGWLEVNTSALRKGLEEPYPARAVAVEWIGMGGRFTFSDDSHGVEQVATCYGKGLDYLQGLGVQEVWTWERGTEGGKAELREKAVSIEEFRGCLRMEEVRSPQ